MGALFEKYRYVNSHVHESNNEKNIAYSFFWRKVFIDGGLAIILYQKGLS